MFSVTAEESGPTRKERARGQPSASHSPAAGQRPEARSSKVRVLVAEDNSPDVQLIEIALRQHGLEAELTVQRDGEEMLLYVDRLDAGEVPCPDVILLDLNLPRVNGHTILGRIRQSPLCSAVPIVIVSSSDAKEDREAAARLGASDYFCKPIDYDQFMRLGQVVRSVLE